jgi:hypothetical protein
MAFHDLQDGLIGPFGLSFRKNSSGTYTTIFTMKDSITTDANFDIYTIETEFNTNTNLGDYELNPAGAGNPPVRGTYFPSQLVDLGENTGTQGNPFLHYDSNGTIKSIWTDDEYDEDADTKKLSVYVLESGTFPSSNNWTKLCFRKCKR